MADLIPATDDKASDDDSISSDASIGDFPECVHPDLPIDLEGEKRRHDKHQLEVTEAIKDGKSLSLVPRDNMIEEDCAKCNDPAAQMLAEHCKEGHLSFEKMLLKAERGDLPRSFLKCRVPVCVSCACGRQTRTPWRTKAPVNDKKTPAPTVPGAVVGMDQLASPTPGFIGQMRGTLTRKRHTVSTAFVDHCTNLLFVHCQLNSSAEQTILAKRAFERFAQRHGVIVKHCHADNAIFDSKAFAAEVHRCEQTISCCGVNAHHMNGKAEKKIRDLQDEARTTMLHAKQRWPTATEFNLWPFP